MSELGVLVESGSGIEGIYLDDPPIVLRAVALSVVFVRDRPVY
jgi:hypothetical protein